MLYIFKQDIKWFSLSHRWRFLCTQIRQLTIFSNDHNEEEVSIKSFRLNLVVNARLENIISNILLKHSLDLEAFHLYNDCIFSYQNVWKWFHLLACPTLSLCINNFCLTSMRKIAFSFILNLYFQQCRQIYKSCCSQIHI